jgi:hypothetical protein
MNNSLPAWLHGILNTAMSILVFWLRLIAVSSCRALFAWLAAWHIEYSDVYPSFLASIDCGKFMPGFICLVGCMAY